MAELHRATVKLETSPPPKAAEAPAPATPPTEVTLSPEGTPPPQATPDPEGAPARPDHIPEKFWDAEKGEARWDDVLKAQQELEKKLGAGEQPAGDLSSLFSEESMAAYGESVAKEGDLSAEQRQALVDRGIPAEMVDMMVGKIKGEGHPVDTAVYDAVGGEEAFGAIAEWTAQNDRETAVRYNALVEAGNVDAAVLLAESMKAKYASATSSPPERRVEGDGKSTPAAGPKPFGDWQEVANSVKDPQYKQSSTYRAAHQARLKAAVEQGIL
jgi:hypothetical protein